MTRKRLSCIAELVMMILGYCLPVVKMSKNCAKSYWLAAGFENFFVPLFRIFGDVKKAFVIGHQSMPGFFR